MEKGEKKSLLREFFFIVGFLLLGLLIRSIYVFCYPFDSDEAQHLHIVWGWTQGLIQYKDFFDNHMPLFHLIFIPILNFIGERSDILYIMRFAVFPFYFLTLYFAYIIGKELYSQRVGMWSAVILSFFPKFFFKSLEFRSDDMWMALWLLVLVVLVKGQFSLKRLFLSGVILGLSFAVSLKTILLSSMLFFAIFIAVFIMWAGGYEIEWKKSGRMIFTVFSGCFLVLCILVIFFAYKNALGQMFYGTIKHNILSQQNVSSGLQYVFPVMLPIIIMFSFFERRNSAPKDLLMKRISFIVLGPLCLFGLISFWPVLSRQDLLPIIPLLVVVLTYLIIEKLLPALKAQKFIVPLLVIFCLVEIAYILFFYPLKTDETKYTNERLRQILNLVRPGEYIVDLKGEAIFRPRPFFYVLETVTRDLIQKGFIRDTIPEDMIEKKCYAALHDSKRFPEKDRKFLNDNFTSVGMLRVAGRIFGKPVPENRALKFNVVIPGKYVIITPYGLAKGKLDNIEYSVPVEMASGEHEFLCESMNVLHAFIWAPAFERGFSPFECNEK
jgi:hypothetical protein